ncbi:hypothetical protein CV_3400 [Chromobacterium violaceum ATCC 12472]|uniref:Uncharacterized protein n=1 Tax=Chromobacterium violaceum (strain ATCC 12472 / DSM 30191 / JCM 1249 / CCUG 213 / NBRC 12614 / NCIMB 9131 / NCTC 9757 / MK) TaxID=243365 RepID=Q7NSM1_CHRVO|nr:hypothetical protein CV_3400 [Chromobacterium violaceum ATCC 12472]
MGTASSRAGLSGRLRAPFDAGSGGGAGHRAGGQLALGVLAYLVGHAGALAAVRRDAELPTQVAHAGGAAMNRLADLAVGHCIAQADIHRKPPLAYNQE